MPSWLIDDLMRFLEQPYYVGLLSAAAIHGAGYQQPMVFQVITDQPTREIRIGRQRIEFHRRS
ncbi:MAG: type IV toxin-antitoxin system AbiEi family antitoxin domain-containing protein [Gemmatimonadota bacterium]